MIPPIDQLAASAYVRSYAASASMALNRLSTGHVHADDRTASASVKTPLE
jgi:hypothetical protein